jgi:DNA (cytosine-5)-methyltransferase 1
MTMTTVLNLKIGEAKATPRLWMEGEKLARAGVKIGARYSLVSPSSDRIELREVGADHQGQTFTVSKRTRHGFLRPLMEIRSFALREIFQNHEKVRVAIRHGRIVITANHLETKMLERSRRLLDKLRRGASLALASLFHGFGVLDKALHAGFKRSGLSTFVKVAVERESAYLDVSLRNNTELWTDESVAVCSDVRDMDWSRNAPQCEVLAAGIPCVGASKSGMARNHLEFAEDHEHAGALFIDYLDAVKAMNPAIVVAENVPEYLNTASMAVIRSVLNSLGYRLHEMVLCGSDFGVLERRRRMVLVGVCKALPQHFDFALLEAVESQNLTMAQALEPIADDSPRWKSYDYLADKAVRDKAAKKGFARQLLESTADGCGTIGKGYAKGRSTEPFMIHPTNPLLSRLLTPVEHARVKGIPLEVIEGESETVAHEGLGQSVIYPKFEAVGFEIGRSIQAAFQQIEQHAASKAA